MDWKRVGNWCLRLGRRPAALTLYATIAWLALWADAHLIYWFSPLTHAIGFGLALTVCFYWARHWKPRSTRIYRGVLSISFIPLWQFGVQVPLIFSAYSLAESLSTAGTGFAFVIGLGWAVWAVDRQTPRAASMRAFITASDRRMPGWSKIGAEASPVQAERP